MLTKLFLVALFLACASAQNFCDIRCSPVGGTCNTATPASTDPYYFCPYQQYCDSSSATCKNGLAAGAACTDSSQCADGVACNVTTCVTIKGQQSDGSYCDGTVYPCGVSSFCNYTGAANGYSWGVCAPLPQTGSACTGACRVTDICNAGTCVKQYSVSNGGTCSDDSACVAGSYCSGASFIATGTCKSGFSSSNGACNGFIPGSSCKTDESCQCQSYGQGQTTRTCQSPVTLSQAAVDAFGNFAQCQINNNCGAESDCNQCNSQGCAYIKAWNNPIANLVLNCGKTPCNSATGVVVSVFSMIIALAVALF